MIRRISLLCLVACLVEAAALAHELGTIRTLVTFHKDGVFEVELIVDREHLPPGFGAAVAAPAPRIEGLTPVLETKIGGILSAAAPGRRSTGVRSRPASRSRGVRARAMPRSPPPRSSGCC